PERPEPAAARRIDGLEQRARRPRRRGEYERIDGERRTGRAEPPRRAVARERADGRAQPHHALREPPRERLDERAHAVRGRGEERVACARSATRSCRSAQPPNDAAVFPLELAEA